MLMPPWPPDAAVVAAAAAVPVAVVIMLPMVEVAMAPWSIPEWSIV